MLEYVKNVIADKETTCEPERNLPTISFCLIPYDMGILMTFQRSSNSYLFPYGTDLSWLDIIRIPPVICGRSSSHIFFSKRARNLSGCQKSACTTEIMILLYCEYHRDHIFRNTIARQATSSYLFVRRVVSTNLFVWYDIRIYLSLF